MNVVPKSGLVASTLISQYANSPTLVQLINNMDEYINPQSDFDAFYDYVWNVETAQGFGLDIWGRIVGVDRFLTLREEINCFGFDESLILEPFGQASMYTGETQTKTFRLSDHSYRELILVKALSNISDCSSASLNRLLSNLFRGRGRCYVSDNGGMQFRYTFEFALLPFELAILTQSGVISKPAAVLACIIVVDTSSTFGFFESSGQPFGQSVLFNTSGLTYAD